MAGRIAAREWLNCNSEGILLLVLSYVGLSDEVKKAYKMGGTPQTIVVSPDGIVIANWNGAYRGKQKESVEDFFKIELPEIDLKSKVAH